MARRVWPCRIAGRLRGGSITVLATAVMVTVVGCGSTATPRAAGQGGAPGSGVDGLTSTDATLGGSGVAGAGSASGPGAPALAGAGPGSGSGFDSAGQQSGAGGPGGGMAPGGGASGQVRGGAASAGSNGPGITATTINVGFLYTKNAAQTQKALGSTVDPGDPYRYQQHLVKDINANGGIAGRKLMPIYYGTDAASAETTEQRGQAACSHFTEDNKVFAALPFSHNVYQRGTLACLRKAGAVAGLASNVSEATNADYNAFPENFDVSATSLDRMCANLIPTLNRGGYFSKWDHVRGEPGTMPVKIGILAPDQAPYRNAIKNVCLPALARAGYPVDLRDVYFFFFSNSASDNGRIVADIQSAGLKFKTDGVTHVMPFEQNGQAFFAQNAENQKYYPRYGVNSHSGTQVYNGLFVSPKQLNGAMGLGYLPSIDLPAQMNPDNGPYSSDARRYCVKVMKEGGESFASTSAQANALALCDLVYILKRIIERIPAGTPINQQTYTASLATLGDVPSANVPSAFLGRGHLDAITQAWLWKFDGPCQCMRYQGKSFRLN